MNSSTTPTTNATTATIKATLTWLTTETPNQPPRWVKATATVVALLATYGILVYEFTTETWSLGVKGLYDLNDTLAKHWVSWWCPRTVKPAGKVTAKSVPASAPVVPVAEVTTALTPVAEVTTALTPVVATEVITEVAPMETVTAEVPVVAVEVTNEMIDTLTTPTPNKVTRRSRRNRTSK